MSAKKAAKKGRGTAGKRVQTAPLIVKDQAGALTTRQLGVILGIGFAFGVGVLYEWGPLNGLPSVTKWGWPWQDLGSFQMGLALLPPFLAIAGVLWISQRRSPRVPLGILLGTLVAAQFTLQLASVLADPRGLERVSQIVTSPDATAYFTDAVRIQHLREWMSQFHRAALTGHAKFHPAGPVLFYYAFVKMFGRDVGAFLGGCTVGLLASFGPVVMYWFAGLWTPNRELRLSACAFYALLPGLTVFFPEFDQIYPIFLMLVIITFVRALRPVRRWYLYAMAMGIAVFVATFFAYNLLTIGAFPVFYGIYWWWHEGKNGTAIRRVVSAYAIALTVSVFLYVSLWAATGYNAPAALGRSLQAMHGGYDLLRRPYWVSIFADLYDFFLGTGIIAAPILWFHLRKIHRELPAEPNRAALTLIALATLLTVDLSGLLRGETARVWLFLQPLVVVPVALELGRVRWTWRITIFAIEWWLLVVIKAKMSFVEP